MSGDVTKSDWKDAYETGARAIPVAPVTIGEIKQLVAVASGYKLEDVSKHLNLPPVDRRGLVTLFDPASFVAYVKAYQDADTLITCDVNARTVTAILDYHRAGEGGEPRHGKHRAHYACRETVEWKAWIGQNGKRQGQLEFAQFLEDNLPDIADPAGADVLDMTRTLEVKKDVAFASSARLSDGAQQLSYTEEIQGSANKGTLKVLDAFTLGIAPFEGSEPFQLVARLRFRLSDGKVSFWYDLLRPHKVIEDAFADVVKVIAAGLPSTRLVQGQVGRLAE